MTKTKIAKYLMNCGIIASYDRVNFLYRQLQALSDLQTAIDKIMEER